MHRSAFSLVAERFIKFQVPWEYMFPELGDLRTFIEIDESGFNVLTTRYVFLMVEKMHQLFRQGKGNYESTNRPSTNDSIYPHHQSHYHTPPTLNIFSPQGTLHI